ncbi:hypothetical protein FIBSPDRAFT_123348 [Athelia psychrophila]|uniref:Uncharacterized protein n=1 Tax=Athelia psychrophila TaxID=1759441 RepID=A0A166CN20_9AGAM|nr:hypothetical protein FIBSPDRAFT_123348 [Fibularhizoctonia sp. CBS 109695]
MQIKLTAVAIAPVSNCQALWNTIVAFTILSVNANNLLFFVRVRAVSQPSSGSCGLSSWAQLYARRLQSMWQYLGPTNTCMYTEIHIYFTSVMFTNALNSTFAFIATSYRITSQSAGGAV